MTPTEMHIAALEEKIDRLKAQLEVANRALLFAVDHSNDFVECKNCGYSDDVTPAHYQGNWFCSDECWMEWSEFNS